MNDVKTSVFLLLAALFVGCSAPPEPESKPAAAAPPETAASEEKELPPPVYESPLPEYLRTLVDEPFTGDLDQMIQRRLIRVGVTFNRTFYFLDKGVQRGLTYEYMKLFEDELNKKSKKRHLDVRLVLFPMPRDQLLPSLLAGKVDAVMAQLTVTPERLKIVDFSRPTRENVDEVVVTGPGGPAVNSIDDLSGKLVFVRKSSSFYDSVQQLNLSFKKRAMPPVRIEAASESLETDDILEMVNAGLVPATIADRYLADFWKQIFTDLKVQETVTLRTGSQLAMALRKNSPLLQKELNAFIAKFGVNTAVGRVLDQRYLQNAKYVRKATSEVERKKYLAMMDVFKKYGEKYQFDYLMVSAQGYQESRLDQNARSPRGAIGVMQLMPQTGKEQRVGDITKLDPNIHAGVKYMRFVRDRYFEAEPMDDLNKVLFTFASYNAGPGRVRQLREEAHKRKLDPNVWFGNVERIASERIGRETVTYVSSIFKYYLAYRLITEEGAKREDARSVNSPKTY
jgi:membrane-bound lytic murein transglycosylase MltF